MGDEQFDFLGWAFLVASLATGVLMAAVLLALIWWCIVYVRRDQDHRD